MPDGVPLAPAAPPRRRERWWLHVLLLVLTFGTTLYTGVYFTANYRPEILRMGNSAQVRAALLRGGLAYCLPVLCILVAHELGHYLTARRYGIDASPPYFIPFIIPGVIDYPGTVGAFIRIREPFRTKAQLFDVGVAGPIAGFVATIPFLAWGITHARPNLEPVLDRGALLFNYPLAVTLLQKLLIGRTYTSMDVSEHPMFMAAWFGLLVTALNLLPLSQLDGGHALYAVFGRHQRTIAIPILIVLAFIGVYWPGWFLWILIALVIGIRHPPVLDEDSPLDFRRKLVAAAVLLIFVVCFAPIPIELI
ncbi:MAG TPA: site-2 protease family protein [Thermoanaerobaculia bacterium]|nr:site-2 protease family protein [Thermoanaerobaculia bacterium]